MTVRIAIDRDKTLAEQRGDGKDIVATFLHGPVLYRAIDGEELRDIVRTRKVRGGLFATPSERRHGASWGADRDVVVKWATSWQRRGGKDAGGRLGKDLFVLELDATGRLFYHMAPKGVRPAFDPFGPETQIATMPIAECSTGLGCSVSNVKMTDVDFYRVTKKGIVPMEREDVWNYVRKKPTKPLEIRHMHKQFSTGWIHGHSVAVRQNHDMVTKEDRFYGKIRVPGPEYGKWEITFYDPDGTEHLIVTGKKNRKAAVDAAEEILRGR